MSLLNTLNPDFTNNQYCDYLYEQMKGVIPHDIVWNDESYKAMYNIILLTLSCFTWCYFITFMIMKISLKTKKFDDLIVNVISLFAGYFGLLLFGYYNIVIGNVIFIIIVMLSLNLQMIYDNNFNMIEYAVINSFLSTVVNIGIFLLLLYKMPFNIMINLNINVGEKPIFTMLNESN
jgi:hypothetical protein